MRLTRYLPFSCTPPPTTSERYGRIYRPYRVVLKQSIVIDGTFVKQIVSIHESPRRSVLGNSAYDIEYPWESTMFIG
jgi:hypothetical protein